MIDLNDSWPAVSQIYNLMDVYLSIKQILEVNSTTYYNYYLYLLL